ncbi:Polyribonucleotide nucleotidyltransferase [Spiroplasma sp. JKS002671]|uniref:S1 RNA-binding domain-containing protein n=1 Tax=Spiroplasma attinicola TaxID=2904537 RepID=UPI002022A0A1|nr:S1 RNA-binding domain-containing protein [Spiroplasma sp. JKS002671]MCL8210979.1 Polyribonucleotide nucleotidyltransferase [Spiroplasma sp. JKS002671]
MISNDKSVDLNNATDNQASDDTSKQLVFAVNQDIQVTPTGFKEYGVFVDCGNGYTGLVHISRITPKFVRNVSDYFTIGQPFTARVIEINEANKKLSLSTKEFNLESKRA